MCLFGLANSSDTFLLLRAQDLGHTAAQVALMYVLYNVTYSALSYPLGSLSDRIGKLPLIFVGWILYALTYWGFSTQFKFLPWLLLPLYGVYMALTDGVSKALVANVSPPDRKGTAMGIFYFATGTSALAASVLAGWLWDTVSHEAPFILGAVLALVSAFMALLVLPFATKRPNLA
jgi:MFS family permease